MSPGINQRYEEQELRCKLKSHCDTLTEEYGNERNNHNWKHKLLDDNILQRYISWIWSLDQETSLEEETATHSSIVAWKILWI